MNAIKLDSRGLVTAIAQHAETGEVLMLGYMNEESIKRTKQVTGIQVGMALDVSWIELDNVESPNDDLRLRGNQQGAAIFARGEGMYVCMPICIHTYIPLARAPAAPTGNLSWR